MAFVVNRASKRAKWYVQQVKIHCKRDSADETIVGALVGVETGWEAPLLYRELEPIFLHLIDNWEAPLKNSKRKKCLRRGLRVKLQQAHDACFFDTLSNIRHIRRFCKLWIDKSSNVASLMRHDNVSLDFAIIDADHTYEGCKSDLTHYWPLIKTGGVLLGDDYESRNETIGIWGVNKAVNEFAREQELEVNVHGRIYGLVKHA